MDLTTKHFLLLGAGFSRNWGGWVASEAFEYLLGCPEIMADERLRKLLWVHQAHQLGGGFESALAELQNNVTTWASQPWSDSQLVNFQNAIGRMFTAMNQAFLNRNDLEFQRNDPQRMIRTFLARFESIFTLNQDILMEHFYLVDNVARATVRPYVPGMRHTPSAEPMHSQSLSRAAWTPRQPGEFKLQSDSQAFFKLHGSSNWFADDGQRVLIMGGGKRQAIERFPILSWYAQQFEASLLQPNARLMIIGYGFADPHINEVIKNAVASGLRIFVINPEGAMLAFTLNDTRRPAHIADPSDPKEVMLQTSLIGGSRRLLREIFTTDDAEFSKVMRFFD
jgi:hypothetical protein